MSRYKDIEFSITDRVARLVLSRPPLNVMSISMMKEMVGALETIQPGSDICALLITSSPDTRAFSAGVSVDDHQPDSAFEMLDAFHGIIRALYTISKPVVAAVSGMALGGGCELVAFADIVLASEGAKFGVPEMKLGVFPPIGCILLPRVIGDKKAREMILTGELIGALEARHLGLVSHLVKDGKLEAKTEQTLTKLRQMSVPALELGRRLMTEAPGLPFEAALKRAEDLYLKELMSHSDPVEGVRAFMEKRPPRWKHK